ncbi:MULTISPECIES: sensor histidine kinase [Streptomyces]|uniref:histidine kinase n=1 Tax=Streptomyces tsukubensis (strain DSM 42081 / NBRC 108919 / NRRL 18488 / 9993) TaxID=1114943 RepID=I2N6F2_STRT9|nr:MULTISPECIES: HAMP domain-containing sensor histidine kinase [Streptomyces]AZK96539.1 two-component sensor histidine kinase [Streptomyces tsukubensis]EIF92599.1 integral membrane sensor signal transduction histidine kinase [Streptomyces tsukubensis NRRL18488]MYS65863.1 HAMP domain-containing protein [Streptomyces sp. SID5473]QKM67458.1 sensor histidine kinase [Streptomyces tsukubensis NRRL18488]TAI42162.1 HAMP domain-containing histidine kinase [Streptomyces tsukubensis]
MRSVRAKAALGATAVVAVALVVAGFSVLLVLRAYLTDQAELQAEVTAREVASQIAREAGDGPISVTSPEDRPVQVVDEDGKTVAVSKDLEKISGTGSTGVKPEPLPTGEDEPDRDQEDDDPERGQVSGKEPRFSRGEATVDGESAEYRFAAVEATTGGGLTVTVYAGAPLAVEQHAVESVREAMLAGLPVLLVVVGGVTWLVTRRALKPVEDIRAEMAEITASEDLSRRVPEPGTRDEVARLARTTNETLAALEASVERQRRFVADASHELRSPIASLRTQLEVGEAHPELLDVPGAVADTVRLQQLAADLLLLARLDAGERPGRAVVDLSALVREQVSQRGGAGRVPVVVTAADGVEVLGSAGQLDRVLGNLLDNAERHAAGEVTVSVTREGGAAVLAVGDDGSGVPDAERERIFERFVRLDDARSRDEGGAGLGLAIARDVAERHGGTLTVGESRAGGALFVLRLPAE